MGFLAPISFWFLSAIPILLLFYFFKKQYDKQPISSIYLWERTINEWETDRWWRKLQKNVLLLLQLLFLLFLIVALTRPFIPGKEVQGDHLVLIFDSSATMAVDGDGETRFSRAKQQARKLVDQLGDGRSVSIIHGQGAPKLLVSNENDLTYASSIIDELQITYQHENLMDSIQLAQSLINQDNGEIHIFTDNLKKEDLEEMNVTKPLVVHNIELSNKNVSIKTFGVRQQEQKVSAIVTVENQADIAKNIALSISNNGNVLEKITKSVPAVSQQTFTINDLPVFDYYQAEIGKDNYQLDNTMFALLPKQQSSSIYLAGDVNPFIDKALQSAGIQTTSVPEDENGDYLFPEDERDSVYILSGLDSNLWPIGPKLIVSPAVNGPFKVTEKVDLQYTMRESVNDPLLEYTNVAGVYLGKAYPIGNLNGLQSLVESGEEAIIAKGNYNGAPTILFAFDVNDSDWPLHPGFPILLTNSIAYLAQNDQTLGYYQPMERVEMMVSPTTEEAVIETLDGENLASIDLNQASLPVPGKPGIYQLHEKTPYGPKVRPFVVQLTNEERTAQSTESFSLSMEGQQNEKMSTAKQELWRWFAAIVLLILFIEWEVYRRGIPSR